MGFDHDARDSTSSNVVVLVSAMFAVLVGLAVLGVVASLFVSARSVQGPVVAFAEPASIDVAEAPAVATYTTAEAVQVVVDMDQQGRLQLEGSSIDIEELRIHLEHLRKNASSLSSLRVVCRVDPECAVKHTLAVLDICRCRIFWIATWSRDWSRMDHDNDSMHANGSLFVEFSTKGPRTPGNARVQLAERTGRHFC